MSTHSVPAAEVAELLRRAIRGEVAVTLADPECPWGEAHTLMGDCEFRIGGWEVIAFNGYGDFDYVYYVVSPDGRTADYAHWDGYPDGVNPGLMLDFDENAELLGLLEMAR